MSASGSVGAQRQRFEGEVVLLHDDGHVDVRFDDGGLGYACACSATLRCNNAGKGLRVAPAAPTPGITEVPCEPAGQGFLLRNAADPNL